MISGTNIKALICLLLSAGMSLAQTPGQTSRQDQPEVLRVFTELVQTDVMVFDKGGKFVKGLTRENFELKIDGKPKPIEFFETVTAGSINEESLLQAARGASSGSNTAAGSKPLDRGRAVFFYVDDVHLDLGGIKESKKVITHFIESEIGQNDEAAIASTSGQIGFLQQLTDNRSVLRAALERLKYRPYIVADTFDPRMTEYHALMIDGGELEIFEYFVVETMRRHPGLQRGHAEIQVRSRARAILQQGAVATINTLNGLEGLVRSVNKQPGRKLVFFISGGFFLDTRNSDSMDRLRRITSAAARSGVVIYSMDARGLAVTSADASQPAMFDPTGRLQRAAGGELHASQDIMNALAKDTGGKTVFNTNALTPGLGRALKDTSTYYLLAWKPEREVEARKFRRIEVRVTGRPELTVQVRRGYFDIEPEQPVAKAKKTEAKPSEKSPVLELRKIIAEPYPNRDLPVSLGLNYIDTPSRGVMLSAAMEMPSELLSFSTIDAKRTAVVNLAGTVYNDRGQVGAFFNNQLKIEAPSDATTNNRDGVIYNYNVLLKPGLYQVRVGARDEKSGRAGSAHGWIEIPDLSAGQFALSSLLVGSREIEPVSNASLAIRAMGAVNLSVARRFTSEEYLRFVIFIYNSALSPNDSKPDLAVQVQVVRDQQPVVTAPLKKISTEGIDDLKRVPYAAEISLKGLPSGRYQLQVSVVDRISKRSASQLTRFDIK
ncbi:MAG TPA: VWA domain-containing protein [Pyrinomonadaceae bacterium]|nr:VWA domain-containing protein [Pyrinomonadaceae bacterium]